MALRREGVFEIERRTRDLNQHVAWRKLVDGEILDGHRGMAGVVATDDEGGEGCVGVHDFAPLMYCLLRLRMPIELVCHALVRVGMGSTPDMPTKTLVCHTESGRFQFVLIPERQ